MSYVVRGTGVRVNGLGKFDPTDPSTWAEAAEQGVEAAKRLMDKLPPLPGSQKPPPPAPPPPAPGFMDQKVLGLPMPLVLLGGAAAVVYFATQK